MDNGIDLSEDRLRLDFECNPKPVVFTEADLISRLARIPDCDVRATVDGAVLETDWCEIHTGEASFQRNQAAVMSYQACEVPVLKIRVNVSALPPPYPVRIEAVAAEEPPVGFASLQSSDPRFDGFT